MSTVIKVENLSKQYRLGNVGSGSLKDDLSRWWYRMRGKEDPLLQIGDTNDRTAKGDSDYVWALKDINFEVQQGDVLGIIGRNGAGKSTLLKILSKTTAPTTGSVKVKGRIASLLEVGTGFHPELTGRENIYLNGAILGMRKQEITRKLDEIIDFAGVERYIDTPVKRYSSGMYVRLAFGVAAHLESEILIIDEVLAVGDAEFQKKCLGKMGDVAKGEGRSVLFVSHNIAAIKSLCNKGIVLNNGRMVFKGSQSETVSSYHSLHSSNSEYFHDGPPETALGNDNIRILSFSIKSSNGSDMIEVSSGFHFEVEFMNYRQDINLDVTFELKTIDDIVIYHNGIVITQDKNSQKGIYTVSGFCTPGILNAGVYRFNLIFGENSRFVLFNVVDLVQFEIQNELSGNESGVLPGLLKLNFNYEASFEGKG
jgi:lipopolysaccharide transport system ATP-binding protein